MTAPYSGDGKGHIFTPGVGSQVLVSYEHGLPEFPVVVGNVFHPPNKQGAKYSPPSNNMKGLQTAGGNNALGRIIQEKQDTHTLSYSCDARGQRVNLTFSLEPVMHWCLNLGYDSGSDLPQ